MIVLIPSLEPGSSLPWLVQELQSLPTTRVVVIDDGSGPAYAGVFAQAEAGGATVIGYPENRGKGSALRTGLQWCIEHAPGETVVCADSDGQHTPSDIALVAREAEGHPDALILGVRAFSGKVPVRSRFGNAVSAGFFWLSTGVRVCDTQTGLRAYGPHRLERLLEVSGDRFEWELNALVMAADEGWEIRQIPIATVYEGGNSGSHFRPVRDSVRVMWPLLAFAATGMTTWVLEFVLFVVLQSRIGIIAAVVLSRVMSGAVNFGLNKLHVFGERSTERTHQQALQYTLLALGLMGITMAGVEALTFIGLPAWLAKITMDIGCFGLSYVVQRRWIFARRGRGVRQEELSEAVTFPI